MYKKEHREAIMSDEDRIAAWKAKGKRCIYCLGQRPIETITDRLFGCCHKCAEWDNNAQVVCKGLPCVSCGENLKPTTGNENEEVTINTVDHQGFHNGMATKISCGYGSTLDGNVYMIALCDDCARELHDCGRLTYVYNYIPNIDGSPKRC